MLHSKAKSSRSNVFLLIVALFGIDAIGGSQTVESASTIGQCSPIVVGSKNSITCANLSKEDARKLADIVNQLRASNVSLDTIKSKLDEILIQVRKTLEAQDPTRPNTTYLPDGETITSENNAGLSQSLNPGEVLISHQMDLLRRQGDWRGLLKLAEEEQAKGLPWYTPYYFAGIAYGGLCDYRKADENLNLFLRKAPQVPNYESVRADARKMLYAVHHNENLPQGSCDIRH